MSQYPFQTCDCETLCDVCSGLSLKIKELKGDPEVCHRLRELGFHESADIRKEAHNGALICKLHDSKVVLSEKLAQNIVVEQIEPAA